MRDALSRDRTLTYLHSWLAEAFSALNNHDEMRRVGAVARPRSTANDPEHRRGAGVRELFRAPPDSASTTRRRMLLSRSGN
jgi:hypothetical protein